MICEKSSCKRKIKMVDTIRYKCKCKRTFCRKHYLKHNCNYDYHQQHVDDLERQLQKAVPAKVSKI